MIKTDLVIGGVIFQNQRKGGISRLFKEVLPRICDIDNTLNVYLFTSGPQLQSLPEHNNIEYYEIPNIKKFLRPQRLFREITQKFEETIIRNKFGYLDGAIWHSTYFTNVQNWQGPVVVTVHDMIYERFPELFNRREDKTLRDLKRKSILMADRIICDSSTTKIDVEDFLGIEPDICSVAPLGCSETFHKINVPPEMKCEIPFLLYVGNRNHYKNFISLLKAYSIWERRYDVKLFVVGDELWTNNERRLITELNLQDLISLQTNLTDKQLCILYNQAEALVFPSLYEGFGLPLLEAMNCGCPIVASDIPSTREVAQDIPIYFDPKEIKQMTDALDIVMEEGRTSQRVKKGYLIARNYSWDKTAIRTLDVYKSLL